VTTSDRFIKLSNFYNDLNSNIDTIDQICSEILFRNLKLSGNQLHLMKYMTSNSIRSSDIIGKQRSKNNFNIFICFIKAMAMFNHDRVEIFIVILLLITNSLVFSMLENSI
jgi:hypothetical protein